MNNDFDTFKKHFKKYQQLFGLTGYKVYFKYEPIDDDCFADITIIERVATVRLNKSLPLKHNPFRDVEQSAKHEAIHLLIHRLEYLARCRYLFRDDIDEATEELVVKLEDLIK